MEEPTLEKVKGIINKSIYPKALRNYDTNNEIFKYEGERLT